MAVELGRFITEQLSRLPENHPDRPFISALHSTLSAYTECAAPAAQVSEPVLSPQPEATAPVTVSPSEAHERERVTFSGRVGATPTYRTTTKGRFLARIPVAEHLEGQETPVWHTVFAFDDRARKLRDQGLAKGAPVEIVGYKHQRQAKGRDGATKLVEDIYAVAVRTH
jgi:Single-strand binding protein family